MEITEILVVLFMALIVAAIFFYGFRSRGPWSAFWTFLLILFLAAWAGRLWVIPQGPELWGYGWLPVLGFIFIVAVLIAVASPIGDDRNREKTPGTEATKPEKEAGAAFGIFFWILMVFLFTAIAVGLYRY